MEIAHRFFDTGELRLHVAEQGQGKPVVFLHGFPEGWFSWRAQMSALANAGFRAVAPDLRGYGESDKPRGTEHYKASLIADDVAALIKSFGQGAVPVVGHDWGAPIAFRLAMDHPEVVSRLFILNGPHPLQFWRVLRRSSAQRRSSWYIALFQLPYVPERFLSRPNTIGRMLRGAASPEELAEYERAFSTPESFTPPLNWYRAAARVRDRKPKSKIFDKECRMIWGMRDFALTPGCLEGLEEWLPRVKIERLPNAGHFVQHDARDDVSAILLRDLRE
jgi:pimeloyl-ACP methyl ester carboxylesterase